jgi:single-strand DNA-binding protein
MAKDLNLCQFIGRLGHDPEVKYTQNSTAFANISIACNDDYKDKNSGELVKQTDWIRVTFFGRLAEVAGQYLKKGSQVYVSGKQVTRKWQDQDGNDRYSTEIRADRLQMLGSAGGSSSQGYDHANENQDRPSTGGGGGSTGDEDFDDDIPFITRHGIY